MCFLFSSLLTPALYFVEIVKMGGPAAPLLIISHLLQGLLSGKGKRRNSTNVKNSLSYFVLQFSINAWSEKR
jgi:hypothetical protein